MNGSVHIMAYIRKLAQPVVCIQLLNFRFLTALDHSANITRSDSQTLSNVVHREETKTSQNIYNILYFPITLGR